MRKSILKVWLLFRQIIWKLSGYRHVQVMGLKFRLDPASSLLLSWKDLLIRQNWKKHIVRDSDLTQLHALCETVSKLPHNPVIVDVGAYQGFYAIILGLLVREKHGKVLAIEPVPDNVSILSKNVYLNELKDVVIIEQTAVSTSHGNTTMMIADSQSVIKNVGAGLIDVNIDRLDAIFERNNIHRIDVLIIDVEGAELEVLKSFPWDKMPVPYIMCELHPYNWESFGYTGRNFIEFLNKKNLKCIDMYFQVYNEFKDNSYIGPCFLIPINQ